MVDQEFSKRKPSRRVWEMEVPQWGSGAIPRSARQSLKEDEAKSVNEYNF